MAIVAVFDVPEMSQDQYDKVMKDLETRGAGAPDGRLYHVGSPKNGGWLVVDVWESPEKLDQFAQTLMSVLQEAGITPPRPSVYPAHNVVQG